jgi:hypothetical protein
MSEDTLLETRDQKRKYKPSVINSEQIAKAKEII